MTPESLTPMLATTGPLPRRDNEWAYEVKWDGMRGLAVCRDGRVRIRARTGTDITPRFPELDELGVTASRRAGDGPLVVDGEVVMFDERGRPSFGALQHRMHIADAGTARKLAAERSVVFVVFDVLWTPAGPCVDSTYDERREILGRLDLASDRVLVPSAELSDPDALVAFCEERGLEGTIGKRRDSPYRPGRRTTSWIKTKILQSQEMLVLGWTEGTGARAQHLGALLLGYYDRAGELHYAGKVGTGFRDRELRELGAELDGRARDEPLVTIPRQKTGVHWVEPTLVVQVGFGEWTGDGHLRHPTYKGRRDDKDPRDVIREPVL